MNIEIIEQIVSVEAESTISYEVIVEDNDIVNTERFALEAQQSAISASISSNLSFTSSQNASQSAQEASQSAATILQLELSSSIFALEASQSAYSSSQFSILASSSAYDAEQFYILSSGSAYNAEQYAIEASQSKSDSEQAAMLSTEQAILSSAARDGAEAERIICEDIRDEIQPFLREIRFDIVSTTSYYGKAPKDSLESSPVWTITRIVVDIDGTTTVTTAINVAWADRLTINYN